MNESNWEKRVLQAMKLLGMCKTGSYDTKQCIDKEFCEQFENAALCAAIECGRLDVVKQLVEQGADVYLDDQRALHLAIVEGQESISAFFVEHAATLMENYLRKKQNVV